MPRMTETAGGGRSSTAGKLGTLSGPLKSTKRESLEVRIGSHRVGSPEH